MQYIYTSELFSIFFKLNFFFFSLITVATSMFYFSSVLGQFTNKSQLSLVESCFKRLNLISYLTSFSSLLVSFYFFYSSINLSYFQDSESFFFFGSTSFDLTLATLPLNLDIYGFVLLLLAYVVGFFALLSVDTRLSSLGLRFFIYFNLFILFVFLYVTTSDIVLFFLFYELLLLPSFFFVYFVSYSKKAVQASIYFVIWTQLGSLLVLVGSFYLVYLVGSTSFFVARVFPFTSSESLTLFTLFFFGFGFKVPI